MNPWGLADRGAGNPSVRKGCMVERGRSGVLIVTADMADQVGEVESFLHNYQVTSVVDTFISAGLSEPSHTCCSAKEIFVQVVFAISFLLNHF